MASNPQPQNRSTENVAGTKRRQTRKMKDLPNPDRDHLLIKCVRRHLSRDPNLVVREHEPQLRLDDGVGHEQILHLLQLVLAPLAVGVILPPDREVLEQFQRTHSGTCGKIPGWFSVLFLKYLSMTVTHSPWPRCEGRCETTHPLKSSVY